MEFDVLAKQKCDKNLKDFNQIYLSSNFIKFCSFEIELFPFKNFLGLKMRRRF